MCCALLQKLPEKKIIIQFSNNEATIKKTHKIKIQI